MCLLPCSHELVLCCRDGLETAGISGKNLCSPDRSPAHSLRYRAFRPNIHRFSRFRYRCVHVFDRCLRQDICSLRSVRHLYTVLTRIGSSPPVPEYQSLISHRQCVGPVEGGVRHRQLLFGNQTFRVFCFGEHRDLPRYKTCFLFPV